MRGHCPSTRMSVAYTFLSHPSLANTWKRSTTTLLIAAAHGDWSARRLLRKPACPSVEFASRGLVKACGSRSAAAAHVQGLFATD